MEAELKHVELSHISLSSTNKMFREDDLHLDDLVTSIREKGVIQPVLLRKNGKANHYELVCGERRYKASLAIQATLKTRSTIPAFIKDLTDEEALDLQITENLHRENINPMMEAAAFDWIIKNKKVSTRALAEKIGKSIDYVEERIRLNRLHKEAQEFVRTGVLPLKAALKLAFVPMELHQKALAQCIQSVEGAAGKTYTFAGLERLQNWLSWNVFNELAFADFDITDPELRPSAGSCVSCTKRTKNSGGLFDDVARKDFCLDGGCLRQKQLAQYEKVKVEVQSKFPGAEIVYRSRTHNVDQAFKKLTPFIDNYEGEEISHTEMTKRLARIDKLQEAKAKVAILVGIDRHDGEDRKKKFICLSFEKKAATRSGTSGISKEEREKEQEKLKRQEKQNSLEKELTVQTVLKKAAGKTIPDLIIQMLITKLFDDSGGEMAMYVFKILGLDFEASRWDGGKRVKLKVKTAEADISQLDQQGYDVEENEIKRVVAKLKTEQLNAILIYAFYDVAFPEDMRLIEKELKVDLKAISTKAKEDASTWWKAEHARKNDPVVKAIAAKRESKESVKSTLNRKKVKV